MQQGTPSHAPFGNFPAANSVGGTFDQAAQFQMYGQPQQPQFPPQQFAPQLNQQQQLTPAQQQQQQFLAQQQMFAAQV